MPIIISNISFNHKKNKLTINISLQIKKTKYCDPSK